MQLVREWKYPANKITLLFTEKWYLPIKAVFGLQGKNWYFGLIRFDKYRTTVKVPK